MKVFLFTDPHIGLSRSSHTSVRSRKLLQQHLYEHALGLVKEARNTHATTVCVGDLFDRYTNKEDIIRQGGEIADECDYVLAGNHDLKNNVDTLSSLQLVAGRSAAQTSFVISPDPTQPFMQVSAIHEGHTFCFIPHCFTQEVFVESIVRACTYARNLKKHHYLFLHCNVGEAHGKVEDEGTTLALTDDLQKRVSECFTRVFVGHEHSPRTVHKNIEILGNTFPVHFGEIGDRYSYTLDTHTNELTLNQIFSTARDFKQFELDEFMEQAGNIDTDVGLVEIVGEIKAEEYSDYSRALQKFWRTNEDTLFAVKNNVQIKHATAVQKTVRGSRATLREVISKEVVAAGYQAEFDEIRQDCE